MDSDLKYLLSIQAVRDQASKVFESAKQGNLKHFDYDESRMGAVADYVSKVIDVSNTKSSEIASELIGSISSVTLDLTSTTLSPLMVAGSISKLETSLASMPL